MRRGSRCAGAHTVTHVLAGTEGGAARFGFIVSKQVGTAVVRNTVRRRLKAVCAEELSTMAPGTDVVIRALPAAASADYAQLRTEVRRCLGRAA
ncbi:ribonuclease P protein component [Microbacterium sp.]|uniref:ribonuclease P protein component n=1 Tax=Microbacterium sp. TaxID=51671 RepID=UPI0039E42DDE